MSKNMNIYDFEVKDINENAISLNEYKAKVLLIVNTATKCGLTPQYTELENLYQKYKDDGFEILDFPSNQFLKQAPETSSEINDICTLKFNTTFPRFAKIEVNGKCAHPLYNYLRKSKISLFGSAIKWNFTKFLIDENGNVVKRFAPTTKPQKIEKSIINLLKK